ALVALTAAAALAFAGCGSSSKKASTTATTGGPSNTSSATKSTYTIGMIASASGGIQGNTQDFNNIVNAWQGWVNSHGGVNGHPVKVLLENDGNDPARSTAAAHDLVAKHVIAIIDD